MPSISEIIDAKLKALDQVPDELISSYEKQQKKILKDVLEIANTLEYDDKGRLKQTKSNYEKVNKIAIKAEKTILQDEEIVKSLKSFSKSMDTQRSYNKSIFQTLRGFRDKKVFETSYRNSKNIVLNNLKSAGIDQVFTQPLREVLSNSISTRSNYKELVKQLGGYIEGIDGKDSNLMKHVKGVAWDGFAYTDASYVNTIATSIGIQWFNYSGANLKDSRHFCTERKRGIFHRKEIEQWGKGKTTTGLSLPYKDGKWQGKNPATTSQTIFIYRGGYRCVDAFIPMDEDDVPKSIIERVRSQGFI